MPVLFRVQTASKSEVVKGQKCQWHKTVLTTTNHSPERWQAYKTSH